MLKNFFNNKKSQWIIHALVWAIIFLVPYMFENNHERGGRHSNLVDQPTYRPFDTITSIIWIVLFYFNAFYLIPNLVYKKKFVEYAAALLLLFCITIGLHNGLFYLFYHPLTMRFKGAAVHNIIPFLFTMTVSAAYKTISDKIESDKLGNEKQRENLKTELSFLRSQISPHFLFNVLNNIAALVRLKSSELEPTVIKLSSLMQYMLYDTDEEKVVVRSEAEYLHAYIDLQQQRYGEELILKLQFDVMEDWHTIEPMLLIPFVENAFKHGGALQHPEINMALSVINNKLHFTVKNKFEESGTIKDKTSGIGLTNVKRRLELLYPGKHILKIDQQSGWFMIDLCITLQ